MWLRERHQLERGEYLARQARRLVEVYRAIPPLVVPFAGCYMGRRAEELRREAYGQLEAFVAQLPRLEAIHLAPVFPVRSLYPRRRELRRPRFSE